LAQIHQPAKSHVAFLQLQIRLQKALHLCSTNIGKLLIDNFYFLSLSGSGDTIGVFKIPTHDQAVDVT